MPRILLVDDDVAMREALAAVLRHAGHEVMECGDSECGAECLKTHRIEAVVTDIRMPGGTGLEMLASVEEPRPAFIVITGAPSVEAAVQALRLRAVDFLSKPVDPIALVEAVSRACEAATPTTDEATLELLSPREQEVALLVRDAMTPAEIAQQLHISEHTVRNHLRAIYEKLGVHNRAELMKRLLT